MQNLGYDHCHLQYALNLEEAIRQKKDLGFSGAISCSAKLEEFPAIATLNSTDGFEIKRAFGIHPWYCENLPATWDETLLFYLENDQTALLGEIGLDGIRNIPIETQLPVFIRQLEIAERLNRGIILHGAKVQTKVMSIVKRYHIPLVLVHGFSSSKEELEAWLALGAHISININASMRIKSLIPLIPKSHLHWETDH